MKVYTTEKAPAAIGPYSQAIEANGFSLQADRSRLFRKRVKLLRAILVQAEQVMKNVGAILQAAGGYTDVVKTHLFPG